ncbi:SDR family oxidoreductase [Anaeromyxobacter diazotrophicus]|uniref:Pteridine reductase n=1 Tax=Anaeromyxobacter diazotrophicus TaxID=2590199 RepID=A0A7I9VG60_9BACT|nr:SDR family oxidoreductase [Anaeromyxobacter diazotrophicus]GEJ55384.1 pteridine reductase [Anaeromyxobacter diazotrophicus]
MRRVALVTGAGVRVGEAIARDLARQGWRVAAHYHAHRPRAPLVPLQADLALPTGPDALARAFRARFDRLDLLVCSAAAFEARPLAATDAAAFDAQMDLNARAPLLLARALAPLLRRSAGSIVNVADVGGGLVAWKGFAAYAASKAALVRLTECLALELAPKVRVNAVAPGTVLWPERYPASQRRELTRRIPLGRAGTPGDVAAAVRYLADAPFVTGAVLPVDGGRHLAGRSG